MIVVQSDLLGTCLHATQLDIVEPKDLAILGPDNDRSYDGLAQLANTKNECLGCTASPQEGLQELRGRDFLYEGSRYGHWRSGLDVASQGAQDQATLWCLWECESHAEGERLPLTAFALRFGSEENALSPYRRRDAEVVTCTFKDLSRLPELLNGSGGAEMLLDQGPQLVAVNDIYTPIVLALPQGVGNGNARFFRNSMGADYDAAVHMAVFQRDDVVKGCSETLQDLNRNLAGT
jgi:hypothetical protein